MDFTLDDMVVYVMKQITKKSQSMKKGLSWGIHYPEEGQDYIFISCDSSPDLGKMGTEIIVTDKLFHMSTCVGNLMKVLLWLENL